MSHVTDIILLTSCEDRGIAEVQQWLTDNDWPPLKEIGVHAGGNKAMQCDVWAAAINYFDMASFAGAVAETKWKFPGGVQLLMQDEHDDKFTVT